MAPRPDDPQMHGRALARLAADPAVVPADLADRAAATALATPRRADLGLEAWEDVLARLGMRLAATAAVAAVAVWGVSARVVPSRVNSSVSAAAPVEAWLTWTAQADVGADTGTWWVTP